MTKNIIVSRLYNIAAIVYHNKIQEFTVVQSSYQVGDIYLGIINKIFQSINGAFVDLQMQKKSGFIHASDSGPLKRKLRMTNITKIFTINQKVLVQVIKEPTLQKGPKVTANITLSGKYIILTPFNQVVCIARNITNPRERYYLKALAILIKPSKMGLLFRQCSAGISEEILLAELNTLKQQWNFVQKSIILGVYPSAIYKDNNIVQRILRDFYNPSIESIFVDSPKTLLQLKKYFRKNQSLSSLLNTSTNLGLFPPKSCAFNTSCITSIITDSFKTRIFLPLGGSISIEISEALTIIDVNSGSFNKASTPRETALTINCLAAATIGYQLWVRNITGIVIIDFIDMYTKRDQLHLLKHFCIILQKDSARPQIVQLSELGLVELTRQRRGRNTLESLNPSLLFSKSDLHKKRKLNSNDTSYSFYDKTHLLYNEADKLVSSLAMSKFFRKTFIYYYISIYNKKNVSNILSNLISSISKSHKSINKNSINITNHNIVPLQFIKMLSFHFLIS